MTAKLDLAMVHKLLRLVVEAQQIPHERSCRSHRLVSGLTHIVGAASTSAILDDEYVSSGYRLRGTVMHVGWGDHALRSLEMLKHASRVFETVICAMARITPSQPGAVVTATWHELVVDRRCPSPSGLESLIPGDCAGLGHTLFSTVRLRLQSRVHGLGLYRELQHQPFSDEERNLVHMFHTACEGLLHPLQHDGDDEGRAAPGLSRRERQTLELVLGGLADKEIAERLGISRHTVNQYTKSIYRHYAVTSRAQLLARLLGQPQSAHSLIIGN